MGKERRSTKPRTVVPEHVRAPDDARPSRAQGQFGAERDSEAAFDNWRDAEAAKKSQKSKT